MVERTRRRSRRWPLLVALLLIAAGGVTALIVFHSRSGGHHERHAIRDVGETAPPDLAKLRDTFAAGLDALARGDGADAVRHLGGFTFGRRAVEEYRLYYLANAYQLQGNAASARRTLAALWRRGPQLIYRHDVGFNIGSLYAGAGSWNEASDIYGTVGPRTSDSAIAAEARWSYVQARLAAGDPIAAFAAARNIAITNPTSKRAGDAIALLRAFKSLPPNAPLELSLEERVVRAERLFADGSPSAAVSELATIDASSLASPLRERVLLTRGLALQSLRRFADSDAALQPLLKGQFRFAIPAMRASASNNSALAASINPVSYKTVTEKKKVGTVKVRVKKTKKFVLRPKFQITKKSVKVINLPLQYKKDAYDRIYLEHLKDLLDMPTGPDIRKETLTTLIAIAESKNQDAYMRQLIPQLVRLDHLADAGLQRFWDKAWAAYSAGDMTTARELFTFISTTYTNPNIRRQSAYWLARLDERAGRQTEAAAAFQKIADAPFEDLYAMFAEKHGARRDHSQVTKLSQLPDWNSVAEKSMPSELRLASELTALGADRDARLELQEKSTDANRKWSDALFGQLFYDAGNFEVAYRYLRRAFPQLATIEQSEVPRQVVQMYYPLKYYDWITDYSKQRGLDPFLVMALIRQESSFNPEVRSRVNATGLMQLMPATGNDVARRLHKFGTPRLTDPKTNIELGTYYLKQLIGWVGGSQELALAAYNGGIGNVRKWQSAFGGKKPDEFIESIPFAETRGYVKRITMMRSTYEQMHEELRDDRNRSH